MEQINTQLDKNRRYWIIGFFALLLLAGLLTYKDYGITLDEQISRKNGAISAKYLASIVKPDLLASDPKAAEIPNLHQYVDKDYGVFFELPSFALEIALRLKSDQSVFYMRHLLTFLIFFVSVIFFFLLVTKHFNNWKSGILGSMMLVISPRIFASAFYNSKDLVFMSLFIIATYTLVNFLRKKTWQNALWHSLACAAAIDIRIMGILLPCFTLAFLYLDVFKDKSEENQLAKTVKLSCIYLVGFFALMILFWPFLWENPLENFIYAFKNMSRFRWPDQVMYLGNYVLATDLPWHYIPVWVVISTPIAYSILFISGVFLILKRIVGNNFNLYSTNTEREELLFMLQFFGPLSAVILLNSVLYDDWRQMYFLFPSFLLVALSGFSKLFSAKTFTRTHQRIIRYALILLVGITIVFTTVFMVRNHPYQNMYFSFLSGKAAQDNFERDYWGLSYRKALEHILATDKSKSIEVSSNVSNISLVSRMLPDDAKNRINIGWVPDTTTYYLTNFRTLVSKNYATRQLKNSRNYKEVYSIYADGIKIMSVFKQKQDLKK